MIRCGGVPSKQIPFMLQHTPFSGHKRIALRHRILELTLGQVPCYGSSKELVHTPPSCTTSSSSNVISPVAPSQPVHCAFGSSPWPRWGSQKFLSTGVSQQERSELGRRAVTQKRNQLGGVIGRRWFQQLTADSFVRIRRTQLFSAIHHPSMQAPVLSLREARKKAVIFSFTSETYHLNSLTVGKLQSIPYRLTAARHP
ncbi:hypothetical protein VTI74DRAFT_10899 [Chaetomium olivicolor]